MDCVPTNGRVRWGNTTTPYSEGFLKDLFLPLQPVDFLEISACNMIRNHLSNIQETGSAIRMDTNQMNFDDMVKDISRHFDDYGISQNQWEEGYTSEDVEEVLDYLQLVLIRSMNVQGELVMVWECLDKTGKFPAGDSEVWILSKLSDGYVGAPITTPFISTEALAGFLKDVIDFREGTLELKPVSFERYSTFNMIRKH